MRQLPEDHTTTSSPKSGRHTILKTLSIIGASILITTTLFTYLLHNLLPVSDRVGLLI